MLAVHNFIPTVADKTVKLEAGTELEECERKQRKKSAHDKRESHKCRGCKTKFMSRYVLSKHQKKCRLFEIKMKQRKNNQKPRSNDQECGTMPHKSSEAKKGEDGFEQESDGKNLESGVTNQDSMNADSSQMEQKLLRALLQESSETKPDSSETLQQASSEADQDPRGTMSDSDDSFKVDDGSDGNVPEYKCDQCDKKYSRKSHLVRHGYSHLSADQAFECKYCFNRFASDITLKIHQEKCRQNGKLECSHCGKVYSKFKSLDNHIRSRHKYSTVKCDLIALLQESSEAKPDSSETLLQASSEADQDPNGTMSYHYDSFKVDDGDFDDNPRYKCDQCDKKYSRKGDLARHGYSHLSEDQAFECKHCFKRFASDIRLKFHQKKCRQNGKHECSDCGKVLFKF